ncbi:MAG: hypothetical protein PHQ52_03615 [Candidatus Omnitrophica bacterium]|nr:hypothetical protein [Candidatus Omnitrophota bacterium]
MLKKYKMPKITSVYLDPKQALLQVCAVGGIYINGGGDYNTLCRSKTGTLGPPCQITPKGSLAGNTPMIYYTGAVLGPDLAMPS